VTGDSLRVTTGIGGHRVASPTPRSVPGGNANGVSARPGLLIGGVVAPDFPNRYPTLPCARDPELFQPDGYGAAFDTQIAKAKAICASCPAVAECADWAIVNAEPYGIWGTTTPPDRVLARKRAGLPTLRGNRTGFFDEQGRRVS
jgi:hypothetical protein